MGELEGLATSSWDPSVYNRKDRGEGEGAQGLRAVQGRLLRGAVESGSWCHLLLWNRAPMLCKQDHIMLLSPSVKFSWKFSAWPSCPQGERQGMVNLICVSHPQAENQAGQEVGRQHNISGCHLQNVCYVLGPRQEVLQAVSLF